jgi:hypothetical protein
VLGVLQWLHEEEAVDAPYLQAALAELDASLAAHGVPSPACLHALSLDVALQLGHTFQVGYFEFQI